MGLEEEAEYAFRKALEIEPNNYFARTELGYRLYNGKWLSEEEYNKAIGLVEYEGKWVTREEAEKLKQKMEGLVITFAHKGGEEKKLYGSVTSMDIASYLEKQGIVIDKKKILLEKPIKTLGEFEVQIRIYPEVTGSVKVVVVPEKEG